jgi:hypothetical protein
MYRVLGADQKEYGPVGAAELRQWIAEGRANGQSLVKAEGTAEWRQLATLPEFAADLPPAPAYTVPSSPTQPAILPTRTNGLAIAGFVLSLMGFLCCCCSPTLYIPGLIFSAIGLSQINGDPTQNGRGLAIAGIILAVLGLLLSGGFLISWLTALPQTNF